jgi:hypothetical protein
MRARTRSVSLAFVASFALFSQSSFGHASAQEISDGWRLVGRDNGVLISTRTLPGQSHPTFRGQATIAGSVLHVLAVVLDSPNAIHWIKGASEIVIVREADSRTQFVQMVTNLPWPIRDRDTIMKRTVDVLTPASEFRVRYLCAPNEVKEQGSRIRVHHCDSHFSLRAVEPNKTYVDYQVQIDPGGGLPDWSIHWMEKRVTVDTLSRLATRVENSAGHYKSVMRRWTSER